MNHNQTHIIRSLIREALEEGAGEINIRGPLVELISSQERGLSAWDIRVKENLCSTLGEAAWEWKDTQSGIPYQQWKRLVLTGPLLVESDTYVSNDLGQKLSLTQNRSDTPLTGAWRITLTAISEYDPNVFRSSSYRERSESSVIKLKVISRAHCAAALKHPTTGAVANIAAEDKTMAFATSSGSRREALEWINDVGCHLVDLISSMVRRGPDSIS